jgi:hypothetical protein
MGCAEGNATTRRAARGLCPSPLAPNRCRRAPGQVDDHCDVAVAAARVAPDLLVDVDHMYGERQYAATDLCGRLGLFTESIADLAPSDGGARSGELGEGIHNG